MNAAVLPLAHAGHWLASLAYAMPPIVLVGVVVAAALVARRREAERAELDR